MRPSPRQVAVIHHAYSIPWSKHINRTLNDQYLQVAPPKTDTYLPSRALQHKIHAHALEQLRSRTNDAGKDGATTPEPRVALFVNLLEDYTAGYQRTTSIDTVAGIVHGSHHVSGEPGKDDRLLPYEDGICEAADQVFVATEWFGDQLPYSTSTLGLPVDAPEALIGQSSRLKPGVGGFIDPRSKPSTGGTGTDRDILFNHRLTSEKRPTAMLADDVPPELRDRVQYTGPRFSTVVVKQLKDELGEDAVMVNTPEPDYRRLLVNARYGLSCATYDNFGYSVMDGIAHGCCYFVPETDTTAYAEYMPEGLLYDPSDMEDLADRVVALDDDEDRRVELVEQAQSNISWYLTDRWLDRLDGYLDVDR